MSGSANLGRFTGGGGSAHHLGWPGGWTDSSEAENGDKCAWITPVTSGGSFELTTPTGTFAMQTTWANDGNSGRGAREVSHAIVPNG